MRNKILAVAMAAAGLAVSGVSMAVAVNPAAVSVGAPGVTSIGSVDVTVEVQDMIRISGLNDAALQFGAYSGNGVNLTGTSPACVYRNGAATTYSIVASGGNNAAGVFNMKRTAGAQLIPYAVTWGGTALSSAAAAVGGLSPDSRTSTTCGGAPIAGKLQVDILASQLDQAEPGSYADTLTLTVAAE